MHDGKHTISRNSNLSCKRFGRDAAIGATPSDAGGIDRLNAVHKIDFIELFDPERSGKTCDVDGNNDHIEGILDMVCRSVIALQALRAHAITS
jgi:hypothetical protein